MNTHLAGKPIADNTYQRYGCRCHGCRAAHNERVRQNRADRLATGRLNHGTRSAYDAGCRCKGPGSCSAARLAAP